jgi:hypothetical protein
MKSEERPGRSSLEAAEARLDDYIRRTAERAPDIAPTGVPRDDGKPPKLPADSNSR